MLRINDVYQYQDLSIRILKTLSEHIVWIDINDVKALPEIISKTELFHAIESFEAFRIEDPFQDIALIQPKKDSVSQLKRDENYILIKNPEPLPVLLRLWGVRGGLSWINYLFSTQHYATVNKFPDAS